MGLDCRGGERGVQQTRCSGMTGVPCGVGDAPCAQNHDVGVLFTKVVDEIEVLCTNVLRLLAVVRARVCQHLETTEDPQHQGWGAHAGEIDE